MSITIRSYETRDREAVRQFMAALQDWERQWAPDRVPGATMAAPHIDYLLALAETTRGKTFVAEANDGIKGFLVLIAESEDEDDAHLLPEAKRYGVVTDLYVLDSARQQGIGDRLLAAAEAHAKIMGVSALRIHTLTKNSAAIDFYQARDYQPYELILTKRVN